MLSEAVGELGEEVTHALQSKKHEENHTGEEQKDFPNRDKQVHPVTGLLHLLFDCSQVLHNA